MDEEKVNLCVKLIMFLFDIKITRLQIKYNLVIFELNIFNQ